MATAGRAGAAAGSCQCSQRLRGSCDAAGRERESKRVDRKETAPHLLRVFSSCMCHILQIQTLKLL